MRHVVKALTGAFQFAFVRPPWLSPLPQVEKNGGVHRTMQE